MKPTRKISAASLPLVLAVATAVAAAIVPAPPARAEVINRVVLRVNDEIATLQDYEKRKAEMIDDITRRERDPAERRRLLDQAGEIVFKDLYEELLLRSRAGQLDIEVTDDQIDRSIQQLRENNGVKTDQEWQAALAQGGMSEAKLRLRLKSDLRLREVLGKEVNSKIKVDEEDLRRYYRKHIDEFRVPEQVQLKEIVVLDSAVPAVTERNEIAESIRAAIVGGKTFEAASEGYKTLGKVGAVTDLGWVSPGDLDPGLEKAAWTLARGAVAAPVAGRGGLHLLQVLDRRESHIKTFTEVSAAIQQKEEERVYREKLAAFMADLQKQSLIVADPPVEAAGFRNLLGPAPVGSDPLDALRAPAPAADAKPAPKPPAKPATAPASASASEPAAPPAEAKPASAPPPPAPPAPPAPPIPPGR